MLGLVALLLVLLIVRPAVSGDRSECIDSQLNSTLEYVSIVKYKSVGEHRKNYACTLITQCSVDRLYRLTKQIKAWGGATSAAVYVPTYDYIQQMKDLSTIDTYIAELQGDSGYRGWLTISVLFGHEGYPRLWNCTEPNSPGMPLYPINALRNLAAAGSGSDSRTSSRRAPPHLFYLDVDFVPSAGLSDWVDKHFQNKGKGVALVLPAFESSALAPPTPTRSLQYVLSGIKANTIKPFHGVRFPAGHGPSDFSKWEKLSSAMGSRPQQHHFKPYEVKYAQGYEPYFIVARNTFVPYDERFRGYGLNKCVNVRWLHENGTAFYVLPGHFVVEDQHTASGQYKKFASNIQNVLAAYHAALDDMAHKRMPYISHNTAQLLRAAGFDPVATEDPVAHEMFLNSVEKQRREA